MATLIVNGEDNPTGDGILHVQVNLNGGSKPEIFARLTGMQYSKIKDLEDGFDRIAVREGDFKITFADPVVVSVG
jgi:hypothetical protein